MYMYITVTSAPSHMDGSKFHYIWHPKHINLDFDIRHYTYWRTTELTLTFVSFEYSYIILTLLLIAQFVIGNFNIRKIFID